MDSIHALFYDKKDKRKYQLFSLFLADPRRELYLNRKVTNYSATRKTMLVDRQELEKDLFSLSGKSMLKKTAHGIFEMDEAAGAYAQKLSSYYAKESKMFKIMDVISQKQYRTMKEMCSVLYISSASFYSGLSYLNDSFKDVSITWSTSGISGEERKIRHLLFESYWGIFGGDGWPFQKSKAFFEKEIVSFEQEGLIFNKVEKERLLYWLAITELRLKQACFIKKNAGREEKNLVNFGPVNNLVSKLFTGPYREREYLLAAEREFFITTLICVIKSTISFSAIQNECPPCMIASSMVEKELVHYGEKSGLSKESHLKLKYHLAKASYYIREELDDWYHFVRKETSKYFSENYCFLKKEIKMYFKLLSDNQASIYVAECRNAGIHLVDSLRIMIISREAQAYFVEQVIQKYSQYPIEVCKNSVDGPDIVVTNFSSKSCRENFEIYYEWPLREKCILRIIDKGLEIKKLGILGSSM